MAQYERGMAPAEQKIAGKLRQQLSNLSAMKSHQVSFMEFCLVYRNGISQLLITNHGIFLINQLLDVRDRKRKSFSILKGAYPENL